MTAVPADTALPDAGSRLPHLFHGQPKLAICAPSGAAPDASRLPLAHARLSQLGLQVQDYYRHEARHQRFGGSDTARLLMLHAAAAQNDLDLVMMLRGGYGLSRLLGQLDWDMLAHCGKRFIGYSDFTAFNLALLRHGGSSFSGPMLCDDFTREQPERFTLQQFADCLHGPQHRIQLETPDGLQQPALSAAQHASLQGVLWGGNLAMLCSLLATPYFPLPQQIAGGILFLEDIAEHPYRIERMLLQLLEAGILQTQSALVLGDFSGYRLGPLDNGYDFGAMLDYLRSRLPLPVFCGLPYGHIARRACLPVGAQASLQLAASGWSLLCHSYPHLPASERAGASTGTNTGTNTETSAGEGA